VPGGTRSVVPAARTQPVAGRKASPGSPTAKSGGAIDHWSLVLVYSMGIGTLAVVVLAIVALIVVWFYGQFIWTFTQWDLSEVPVRPFRAFAEFLILGVFLAGTCVGLWCFSGIAWSKPQNKRVRR
jgi:putative flippase GtrA